MAMGLAAMDQMRTRALKKAASAEQTRRTALKTLAQSKLNATNMGQAFLDVVRKAVELSRGTITTLGARSDVIIGDLEAVIIGTGMTEGRGKGPYFAGNFRGSTGFKPEFQDPYNQIQHATAGIVIGFRYWFPGEWVARWLEEEPQDDLLYEATCPIGRWLANWYVDPEKLPEKIRSAILDGTCK